jgi:protein involved in polysaccharide export with SLBB domain
MKRLFIIAISTGILSAQLSTNSIESLANNELEKIKNQLKQDMIETENVVDIDFDTNLEKIEMSNESNILPDQFKGYFGYSYLQSDINFYDNVPTPSNYKLGPGDEIVLSIWGDTNLRESFTINKDGLIYYDKLGFISLANMNLKDAENVLKQELSKVHSTLNVNKSTSSLALELSKLKSLNIFFSGEIVNPGVHLIHPFSDPLSALIQSGGINLNGTLRHIEVIRNNEIIQNVDLYNFFTAGKNNYHDFKLVDGDVIHVPAIKNRIEMSGAILKPSFYEFKNEDSLFDLISFAGGLTSDASSSVVIDTVIPTEKRVSDDYAKSSTNINLSQASEYILNPGDSIFVISLGEVDSKVQVYGKVKMPGLYSAVNSSLKDILDIAGGFDDPNFRKSILEEITVLRKNHEKYYADEFVVDYKNASDFMMHSGDKVFVYENLNHDNLFTYRVEGQVKFPGTYPLRGKISVKDALEKAGGINEISSSKNIVLYQEISSFDKNNQPITEKVKVNGATTDFIISSNTVISVMPQENVVNVTGNVYQPGLIAFYKGMTMRQAIILAGGYRPYSQKKKSYVIRANGQISKANMFRGGAKRLFPGDTVIVSANPDPQDFNITEFIADMSTTLANIAAILIVIDNQNN